MTKTSRASETVKFELFSAVSPHDEQLVSAWHRGARENISVVANGPFVRFAMLWFAFNNWAMRVTEAETDKKMIDALAKSPTLQRLFGRLLDASALFRSDVIAFATFWPIFDVKDIRRKGLRHQFHGLNREAYIQRMLNAQVKHAPEGKFDRSEPSWDQTIHAVYKVRNNLFHGEKGDAADDPDIVDSALRTMLGFIESGELYQRRSANDHPAEPTL